MTHQIDADERKGGMMADETLRTDSDRPARNAGQGGAAEMPAGLGFVYSEVDGFWCWLSGNERWGMTWTADGGLELFTNGHATLPDVREAELRMSYVARALAEPGAPGAEEGAMRYRVRVTSFVVVEARNGEQAKARAELALRKAVKVAYAEGDTLGDGWEHFGWQATKAEKVEDD